MLTFILKSTKVFRFFISLLYSIYIFRIIKNLIYYTIKILFFKLTIDFG